MRIRVNGKDIDTDEANAAGIEVAATGELVQV